MLQPREKPSKRRWPARVLVVLVVLGAAYSAGWYFLARYAENRSASVIAQLSGGGTRLDCENTRATGFPFGFGLRCDSLQAENAAEGISFSAGALRAKANFYNPTLLVGEIDANAKLAARGMLPLFFDWRGLRTEIRVATPLPKEIRVIASRFNAYLAGDGGLEALLLSLEEFAAVARPVGRSLEVSSDVSGFALDQSLTGTGELPPVDADIDLVVDDGAERIIGGFESLRGASGTLRQARISPGPQGAVTARGTFSVDGRGLIDADLAITVRGAKAMSEILIELFPDAAGEIASAAASLEALGEDAQLPLRIVAGRASFGLFRLGDIPPLP